MKKICQNYFFAKSCLSSVLTPYQGFTQPRTTVSPEIVFFVVKGAYLGHFGNGNFRQIVEISGMVETSALHITSKERSSVE